KVTMTNASLLRRAQNGVVSDEDPAPKPTRRQFSAACKLSILAEYEQLSDPGTKGALLRREGLYSSHIVEWRRAREAGALAGLAPKAPVQARAPSRPGLSGCAGATCGWSPSSASTARRWRSREKHRSSCRGCWPRATRRRRSS